MSGELAVNRAVLHLPGNIPDADECSEGSKESGVRKALQTLN